MCDAGTLGCPGLQSRDAEIAQSNSPGAVYEEVAGLDVAVDDSAVVRCGQGVGGLRGDLGGPGRRELLLAIEQRTEAFAFNQFGDRVGAELWIYTGVGHAHDARMADGCRGLGFLGEALNPFRVLGPPGADDLDRYGQVEPLVYGSIHPTKPALTDDRLQSIAASDKAASVIKILRHRANPAH